jgi:cyanate permease
MDTEAWILIILLGFPIIGLFGLAVHSLQENDYGWAIIFGFVTAFLLALELAVIVKR